MNEVQKRIFDHLTQPGHPERIKCLEDLCNGGFPSKTATPRDTLRAVDRYLELNPRRFCAEGIQRLRDAMEPPKPKSVRQRVTVTLTREADDLEWVTRVVNALKAVPRVTMVKVETWEPVE